jgi:putative phosphoribosyl transferase
MTHLPFADRIEAGRILAAELTERGIAPGTIVLALARGGVPVGFSVAERLHLPLDVVIARKLGVPWQPEVALGAVTTDTQVLDAPLIRLLGIPAEDIEEITARAQAEIARLEMVYRKGEPPADLRDRTVVLVDDGIATGSTTLAALRHVRRRRPAKLVLAIPVASRNGIHLLRPEADEVVCVAIPDRFFSVGEWYREFPQLDDEEVRHLLQESHRQLERSRSAVSA